MLGIDELRTTAHRGHSNPYIERLHDGPSDFTRVSRTLMQACAFIAV